ncbi:hypothetical protein [Anabaena azotica]|uniref:Uncharacterized protein n=1 Tax=Anabaena azotica FACHB-119 TaxID=947527 RepID=A0ABR8D3M8_9NOST|nr:hypothetical protein [Anabaena azotica]MBD2501753.1 hypothetical protein [Anabaena azotica FACHB-119]
MATVLTVCQTANAGNNGLNVGSGRITPGLEKQYLQYQLQNNGNGLRQIRVIPDNCAVGFGLRCNKTGTVLEQIVESNGGPTYQQMLMRAAGGEDNYNRFAKYFGDRIDNAPYNSVWRNHSATILDAAQYNLGKPLNSNPQAGLRDITKNFFWQPLPGGNQRDDFVNFKYSYGRVLLEEVSKIPNIRQQILELPLGESMKEFYERQILSGLNALQTGDSEQLQQNILSILSRPYSPTSSNDPWYGREEITALPTVEEGETLTANVLDTSTVLLGGEDFTGLGEIPGEETSIVQGGSVSTTFLFLPLLAFLFFLGGDNGSSNSVPGGNTINNGGTGFICSYGNNCDRIENGQRTRVDEPSVSNALVLLTLMLCLLGYRKRYVTKPLTTDN